MTCTIDVERDIGCPGLLVDQRLPGDREPRRLGDGVSEGETRVEVLPELEDPGEQ